MLNTILVFLSKGLKSFIKLHNGVYPSLLAIKNISVAQISDVQRDSECQSGFSEHAIPPDIADLEEKNPCTLEISMSII